MSEATPNRLTVAELREWLKLPHRDDDPAIASALRAACAEYQDSTGRAPADWCEAELMAIRQRVAALVGYRGDDQTPPSDEFFRNIRRLYSGVAIQ